MKILIFILLLAAMLCAGVYHPAIDYIFPLPDTKLHSIHTTVLLRLDESLKDKITDLSAFISVEGEYGDISGHVFFAADERTIIFQPDAPFHFNEAIRVHLQVSQLGYQDFVYDFFTVQEGINELEGLPKNAAPVQLKETLAFAPPRLVNGVAVPSDFPNIETHQYGETAPGRIFFASTGPSGGKGNYVVICENDGTPYFYRRYPTIPRTGNLTVHTNGELSFHCYETFCIVLDRNFVEVDTIWAGHGHLADDHELQILENGNILQVVRQDISIDMSQVISGGKKNATVEAHHLQEMDKDKNVIFEWRAWDHLDILDTFVSLYDSFIDFVHMNSIAIDYDGNYIISVREYKMIVKIDRLTGETIWRFGGGDSDFTLVNEDLVFHFEHDARPVPGKPNHYTLFDNGRNRYPQFSRGVEYKLDLEKMTAEKVWEYRHHPDWYSGWMGSVQRFANGNTLVEFPDGGGRMNEVDKNNNIVWEMFVNGTNNYRCRRYEWDGMMQQPYLIVENMGAAIRLIFNKFGDKDVDHYRIYSGDDESNFTLQDTTCQTWFDIDALLLGTQARHYFKISAVDKMGSESGFSNIENAYVNILGPGENAVDNGNFQSTRFWRLRRSNGAQATGRLNEAGEYEVSISKGGTDLDDVRLEQTGVFVMQGHEYVLEFDASSSSSRALEVKLLSYNASAVDYSRLSAFSVSNRQKHFKFEFTMTYATDTDARLVFNCGGQTGTVSLDNVSLTYSGYNQITPLVEPWLNTDIGQTAFSGGAGLVDDQFVIQASGNDIWNENDAFHFVYQAIEGDAEIIARVNSLQDSDPWAKAGVMMRNALNASSRHIMMIVTPENGLACQRRLQDSASTFSTPGRNEATPYWIRLVRKGNVFTAFQSADGEEWQQVESQKIEMENTIFIGLAVTSHNDSQICEAQMDHVQLITDSNVQGGQESIPKSFALYQAFPNPFNPQTSIRFDVPYLAKVQVQVYDIQGRLVRTLVDRNMDAGEHNIQWNGTNDFGEKTASGLYFFRLVSDSFESVNKVTFLK